MPHETATQRLCEMTPDYAVTGRRTPCGAPAEWEFDAETPGKTIAMCEACRRETGAKREHLRQITDARSLGAV